LNPTSSVDPVRTAEYRTRFAPSPTGPLHLGSLYTALAGFLEAKARAGQWHLRIDDLDPYRTIPTSVDQILYALETLGLHWNGPILYQSQRHARYDMALEDLRIAGLLYACTCSRKELAAAAAEEGAAAVYPGFCRPRRTAPQGPHALRVLTAGSRITFIDRLQGTVTQDLECEIGDFIVRRRDRVHAYHLATVLDDHEQGITEVLRGFDLLDSTPRQIYLQELLGLAVPRYAHVPILVDGDGYKLSKQTHAPEVELRHPARTLFFLLKLLKQDPPVELAEASRDEVLDWGIGHWNLARLTDIQRLPL
jgi:glutamyl-Q tRNA(Asp) synthetase